MVSDLDVSDHWAVMAVFDTAGDQAVVSQSESSGRPIIEPDD